MHYTCPHCSAINRLPQSNFTQGKCGQCKQALFTGAPVNLTSASFSRFLQKNDLPVIVDFWAGWCGPCQMMAPVFQQLAGQMQTMARFAKVDTEANQNLAASHNIRSLPSLVIYHQGKEIERLAGALPAAQLQQWLERHLPKI